MPKKSASQTAQPDDSLLNLLDAAQVAAPAKKAKKDDTVWWKFSDVSLMADVVLVATCKWAMNAFKTIVETKEARLKAAAIDQYFVPRGIAAKAQPENMKVESDKFVVGFQLKKRSTASALTDEDQGILASLKVPFAEDVKTPAGLMINPEHLTAEVLRKLQAVIKQHPELPSDLITAQQKVSSMVVTEESIKAMWQLSEKDLRIALPILTTNAITYGAAPVGEKQFYMLEDILFPQEEEAA